MDNLRVMQKVIGRPQNKKTIFLWLGSILIMGVTLAFTIEIIIRDSKCSNRPLIGSYYYPWYTIDRWTIDQNAMGRPQMGFYDNSNPAVINKHIEWAHEAGIDYFIYSWLGTNRKKKHEHETRIANKFIEQTAKKNMKITALYEMPLALNQSADRIDFNKNKGPTETTGDWFVRDMLAIADQGSTLKNYLKINGCPRVAIYLARNMVNFESSFVKLKNKLRSKGQCLDIIADVSFWGSSEKPLARSNKTSKAQWDWMKDNFSGIFGYNMYSDNLNVYGLNKRVPFKELFLTAKTSNHKEWSKQANQYALPYYYSIQPGYDDRALRGAERPATSPTAEFLKKDWERVSNNLKGGSHVFITSFNEWYEGTAIEPSKKDGKSLLTTNRKASDKIKKRFCE